MISRQGSRFLIVAGCLWFAADTVRAQIATIDTAGAPAVARVAERRPSRKVFASLYAGLLTTQALDVHSTLRSIDAGGRETNPMVRWAASSPASFIGIKAAATTGTMLLVDRVRRTHPKAALFLLVAIDSAYASVIAHNYRRADWVSR